MFWYLVCLGIGNWVEDKVNGDYVSVIFKWLVVGESMLLKVNYGEKFKIGVMLNNKVLLNLEELLLSVL